MSHPTFIRFGGQVYRLAGLDVGGKYSLGPLDEKADLPELMDTVSVRLKISRQHENYFRSQYSVQYSPEIGAAVQQAINGAHQSLVALYNALEAADEDLGVAADNMSRR